jgi:hypothetical protein
LARALKGRRGTWVGVRLDWFGVRVALGAVATAVLLLGLRGSHGSGLLARGAPPWPAPAPSVYTSDDSGIVHVASDSDQSVFTLGQFFGEWQVALSRGRLGGLRASTVSVFLDGSPVAGPPGSVLLTPHLQIAVTDRPGGARVPATYAFPAGT